MYINYPIVVKEITAPCTVHEGNGFYIRAFPLHHSKTCVGYTLEELDRPGEFNPDRARELGVPQGPLWGTLQRGEPVTAADGSTVRPEDVLGAKRSGRKFSFVTDSLYLPSIAREVRGSDLLICEGMFADDCADQAREKRHMTARQAATVAHDAGVSKLGLIHYSPRYVDHDLDIMLRQAQEVFPNTVLTRDRMVFEIPYTD